MPTTDVHTGIELCICTFNRVDYLRYCIEALLPQLVSGKTLLTVVDNHSTDGTKEYVEALAAEYTMVRYVFEPQQGLSYARNKGWAGAQYPWVFYLDDDCLPPGHIVNAALDLIDGDTSFDAIGGPIDSIFHGDIPDWLPKGFGDFSMPYDDVTIISKGYIRGGCMLIKRGVLKELGGFKTSLGVTGDVLRYGEEFELQVRMRDAGYIIAYAPSLRTGHYVRTDKLSLSWALRSQYARQRDRMVFDPVSLPVASFHLIRTLAGRFLWTPIHLASSLFNKSYSLKRALYESLQPLAFSSGEWVGTLRYPRKK